MRCRASAPVAQQQGDRRGGEGEGAGPGEDRREPGDGCRRGIRATVEERRGDRGADGGQRGHADRTADLLARVHEPARGAGFAPGDTLYGELRRADERAAEAEADEHGRCEQVQGEVRVDRGGREPAEPSGDDHE